jgi:hypothetical protein
MVHDKVPQKFYLLLQDPKDPEAAFLFTNIAYNGPIQICTK